MTTKWDNWAEGVTCLALVAAVCVGGWFLPEPYVPYLFGLLAIGVLFDLLSFFYHTMTLVTGKFMSGLPFVGLFFYVWFVLAYPGSLFPGALLVGKLLDLLALGVLHALLQSPMFFQGPRDSYK